MAKRGKTPGKQQLLQLLQRSLQHLNLGVTITDLNGTILFTNDAEAKMHGYEIADLIGQDARIFAPRDLWKGITADQARELSTWQRESINIRKDGTVFPVQIISDVIPDESGNPQAVITICEDLSEKRSSYAAYYDLLTGLPNRMLFMDRLGRSVKRTKRRNDYVFALLYIDLDGFKGINDSSGRRTGDRLLNACARRIEACVRFGDTVAYVGGDEYAVLLEDIRAVEDAMFVANRIQEQLTLPFSISDHDFFITASIGIAKGSSGYDRPEDILRDAGTAMYRAKVQGRARYEFFDETMLTRAMALLPLEISLRRAIEREELQLEYQPYYSLQSQKIEGIEAFLRWDHPERGTVYPEEFTSIAEETSMMAAVGEWVLQKACTQLSAWHQTAPYLTLSLRVTPGEVILQSWGRALIRILKQTGIDPSTLEIQISETGLMQRMDELTPVLDEIRKQGVRLAICNYGTGNSTLEYLKRFKIEGLKLDRAFLQDITANAMEESVARAMITLAHSLKIRVLADGVENEEQLDFLRWHHCDAAQGDLLSPQLSAEKFTQLLTQRREDPRREDA
jgi:diguanylate cyclase (GGDEF)-like protein/PAS domain S-box-containing protein